MCRRCRLEDTVIDDRVAGINRKNTARNVGNNRAGVSFTSVKLPSLVPISPTPVIVLSTLVSMRCRTGANDDVLLTIRHINPAATLKRDAVAGDLQLR